MMDDYCTILFVYILDIKDRLVIGKDQMIKGFKGHYCFHYYVMQWPCILSNV